MFSRTFWISLFAIVCLLAIGLYSLPKLRPDSFAAARQHVAVIEDVPPETRQAVPLRRGPCAPGAPVLSRDQLSTEAEGWASLCLADTSRIYVGGGAALQIDQAPDEAGLLQPNVNLTDGKIWIDLRSGSLTVTTDIGAASVTGSLMSVSYSPTMRKMVVTCAEGHCRLRGPSSEVSLNGLEQSALVGASAPSPAQPIEVNEILDWFAHVPGLDPGAPTPALSGAEGATATVIAPHDEPPTLTEIASALPTDGETASVTPTELASATSPASTSSRLTAAPARPSPSTSPPATRSAPTAAPVVPTRATTLPPTRPAPTATSIWIATVIPPPTPTPTPTTAALGGLYGAGPIPGPSPTWSVHNFPTPYAASGPTKIGFHVTLNSGGALDYVAAVHPPVMKGVDDIGYLKDVKALSPGTITIGRYVVPQPNIGEGDPAQRAIDFVNEQLPRYQQHADYVDYWEGWNEVTYPNYEWYAVFEATRACEMQKHGLKAAIGAFSAGTPEPWQFMAFLPAIEAGIRCGAILTTHEYGAPTMYLWWSQGLPESYGHSPVPAYPDRGPLMGRYRFLYRDILLPRGLIIPLVISESGIDGGAGAGQRPGYGGQGWLGFRDYWSAELGVTDPVAFYVNQLAWYDSLLRQDSYVIGATIFNVSGGNSWETFEASSIIPKLIEYAQGLQ